MGLSPKYSTKKKDNQQCMQDNQMLKHVYTSEFYFCFSEKANLRYFSNKDTPTRKREMQTLVCKNIHTLIMIQAGFYISFGNKANWKFSNETAYPHQQVKRAEHSNILHAGYLLGHITLHWSPEIQFSKINDFKRQLITSCEQKRSIMDRMAEKISLSCHCCKQKIFVSLSFKFFFFLAYYKPPIATG